MEIDEILKYREGLFEDSKDEDGFISENGLLSEVMPLLFDAKLIDSEAFEQALYNNDEEKIKINGYIINESGERLQIFIVSSESIRLGNQISDLLISQKSIYDESFNKGFRLFNKAVKGHLNELLQDGDPIKALVNFILSAEGKIQIDVVEIFLITATVTIETRGVSPRPKNIDFDDDNISFSFTKDRITTKKEVLVLKKLIDLNYLYNVHLSQGIRDKLLIDFEQKFNFRIPVLQAADELNFESYLCVLPADIIADLYKKYSSRLLEKNVRSFLEFRSKSVNAGMRETIRKEPEKFIAFNNGLTITATQKEIVNINNTLFIKSLQDFQIVNGGQTTASIYFTRKDGIDVSKVRVMAKINVAKDITEESLDEMISKISQFSNSQSRVSAVDLRSRSPQLNKIKSLSDSVVTPTGKKWFFEKSRGEFNTLLRLAGNNRKQKEKEYPKQRKFSKEELGKYFMAWGVQPYLVKKGGEKVFRQFIEVISGESKPITIDRDFFEELMAKIILFRTMESIYGQGKNSMGQLRSAVVPYSISIIYKLFSEHSSDIFFDLRKIWIKEGIEKDLEEFIVSLMTLMNDLIKIYSVSEDYGEFSKRKELWENISDSPEIKSFLGNTNSIKIIKNYGISAEEYKKRKKRNQKKNEVDFSLLSSNLNVFSNGSDFYIKISELFKDNLSTGDNKKIESVVSAIINLTDLDDKLIKFEQDLIHRILSTKPEIFDSISFEPNNLLHQTADFIILKYNKAIEDELNVESEFTKIKNIASAKGIKYSSVYGQIGEILANGQSPGIKQINDASYYFMNHEGVLSKPEREDSNISELIIDTNLLTKMVEWDSKYKVLKSGERQYLADLAYGLKKLNDFHRNNAKKHLQTLIKANFKVNS